MKGNKEAFKGLADDATSLITASKANPKTGHGIQLTEEIEKSLKSLQE